MLFFVGWCTVSFFFLNAADQTRRQESVDYTGVKRSWKALIVLRVEELPLVSPSVDGRFFSSCKKIAASPIQVTFEVPTEYKPLTTTGARSQDEPAARASFQRTPPGEGV